jgi:outer membrane biosynthesis protein TonB
MSWKRWFLTGCLGLLAGFTNAQTDRPSALLTLHSNHPVPSLQEQTWLLELQHLLQSRYYLWIAAETPVLTSTPMKTEASFGFRMQPQAGEIRLEMSRNLADTLVQHVVFCLEPCTGAGRAEALRTLLTFVEPNASELWAAALPPVPEWRGMAPQRNTGTSSVARSNSERKPVIQRQETPAQKKSIEVVRPADQSATLEEKLVARLDNLPPANSERTKATTPPDKAKKPPAKKKMTRKAAKQEEQLPKIAARVQPSRPLFVRNDSAKNSTTKSVGSSGNQNQLEQFRHKIAERSYNRQIWQAMRNQLMFFRQENSDLPKPLPLRVRLQIDVEGKVIGQEILETSQVPEFDALVLKTAPLLELPPPDETLVREPPYMVVVQVAP